MAIPVGAQGGARNNRVTQAGNSSQNRRASRGASSQANTANVNRLRNTDYLNQLQSLLQGGGQGGGGGGFGGGGSGGGGGGGGYDYGAWQRQMEEERQRKLEQQKYALSLQAIQARDQAMPQLQQYRQQYDKDIGGIYAQNRGLNAGYNQQLQSIQGQMNRGTTGTRDMLTRDLQAQGGASDIGAIRSAASADVAGNDFLSLLGQQYNTRLAQVMAQRQADAQSMGATIDASSKGNLQNTYAQLLAQIGLIGLQ